MMESNPVPPPQSAHLDQLLDEALEHTFPASDPIAIGVERNLPSQLMLETSREIEQGATQMNTEGCRLTARPSSDETCG